MDIRTITAGSRNEFILWWTWHFSIIHLWKNLAWNNFSMMWWVSEDIVNSKAQLGKNTIKWNELGVFIYSTGVLCCHQNIFAYTKTSIVGNRILDRDQGKLPTIVRLLKHLATHNQVGSHHGLDFNSSTHPWWKATKSLWWTGTQTSIQVNFNDIVVVAPWPCSTFPSLLQ